MPFTNQDYQNIRPLCLFPIFVCLSVCLFVSHVCTTLCFISLRQCSLHLFQSSPFPIFPNEVFFPTFPFRGPHIKGKHICQMIHSKILSSWTYSVTFLMCFKAIRKQVFDCFKEMESFFKFILVQSLIGLSWKQSE